MVSLPLMARLLDAVPPGARLVLVGDQHQLASVEAGAVLGDIVAAAGPDLDRGALAGRISLLTTTHRFGHVPELAELADAVRAGDADLAVGILAEHATADPADAPTGSPGSADRSGMTCPSCCGPTSSLRPGSRSTPPGPARRPRPSTRSAPCASCAPTAGDRPGVEGWNRRIESWLADELGAVRGWYPGRPVLVTRNDYRNRLFNGDMGVVVAGEERPVVAFAPAGRTPDSSPPPASATSRRSTP
jgi:exodeoxyribonuclease V alpha subunit